jgi:hypothetical protein
MARRSLQIVEPTGARPSHATEVVWAIIQLAWPGRNVGHGTTPQCSSGPLVPTAIGARSALSRRSDTG